MEHSFHPSKKGCLLKVKGNLTIDEARQFKTILKEGLDKWDKLSVNMEKVEHFDLTCLQLLCAAYRTSTNQKKQLLFRGEIPEALKSIANRAGYLQYSDCKMIDQNKELWIIGGENQ